MTIPIPNKLLELFQIDGGCSLVAHNAMTVDYQHVSIKEGTSYVKFLSGFGNTKGSANTFEHEILGHPSLSYISFDKIIPS